MGNTEEARIARYASPPTPRAVGVRASRRRGRFSTVALVCVGPGMHARIPAPARRRPQSDARNRQNCIPHNGATTGHGREPSIVPQRSTLHSYQICITLKHPRHVRQSATSTIPAAARTAATLAASTANATSADAVAA